jgi:DNA-binding CsgD family transcriptional regulator
MRPRGVQDHGLTLRRVLVGRHQEQSVLDEMLATARTGRASVLALVGEPGIGKSALVAYAEEQSGGMRVLRARGMQTEAAIPFASLSELLRPALDSLGRIPAPQARALEGALALRPARSEDRFAIGAATLSLLAAYANEAPLLVTIDDAHWLDGSSANAVGFAARRLIDDPVAIVLAVREGESSLLDGTDLPRLQLAGLDRRAVSEFLRRRARVDAEMAEARVDRLYAETRGNPLALLELNEQASWLEDSPVHEPLPVVAWVAEKFARGFESLNPEVRRSLVLLAACDTGDLETLARAARTFDSPLEDSLDEAAAAGLVEVQRWSVEWRHPLIRSAVYGRASATERRSAHRALADALPDAEEDRRAWHRALAAFGPDDAAALALEQAAVRARARSAYEVSSRTFERAASLALDRSRQGHLLYAAADTAWLAGLGDRAVSLLDEAARRSKDRDVEIRVDQLRGHIATRRGHIDEGGQLLVDAARKAAPTNPPLAVVLLAEAVNAFFYAGDAARMREIAAEIPTIAARCTDARSGFFASMSEGMALVFSGEGSRGPRMIRHAVDLLQRSDELRDDPRLLAWAAMGPLWLRDASGGRVLVARALAAARERSVVGVMPFLLSHIAIDLAAGDRWAEAEAMFYEAIDLARESGQDAELGASLSRLALLEARMGKESDCRAHATEALELSARRGLGLSEVWALEALGDLEFELGRLESALANYEQQLAVIDARAIADVDLSPAPELVEIYLRTGRSDRAKEVADAYWRRAAAKGLPWSRSRAHRALALVASDDTFEADFVDALADHGKTLDLFETARTRLAYGSRLRRSRQRIRARVELRAAIDAFDRLGADPWAELARIELAASGERARRRGESALRQLTPQELQVAMLLAERRTTREAAAALFLSPKTVEYHLRNIYRKLDVSTRDELIKAMSSSTEADPASGPSSRGDR